MLNASHPPENTANQRADIQHDLEIKKRRCFIVRLLSITDIVYHESK